MGGSIFLKKQSADIAEVNYKENTMVRKINKFIDKPIKIKKEVFKVEKKKGEIIKKGNQTFVKCPKCGWIHTIDTVKCRFCGAEL